MAGKTYYARGQTLQAVLTPGRARLPQVLYLAVTTNVPGLGHDATSAYLSEPRDPAYQRVAVPCDEEHWAFAPGTRCFNRLEVLFPVPTTDWGVLLGWALCTEVSGGWPWYGGELVHPVRVVGGPDAEVVVPPGALVITE